MKKIFSFILVVLMVIGIGVAILNFSNIDLKANPPYQDPQERYPGYNMDCWKMPWDCDRVTPDN